MLLVLNNSASFAQLKTDSNYSTFKASYISHQSHSKNIILTHKMYILQTQELFYSPESVHYNSDSTSYNTAGYRSIKIGKQVVLSQISGAALGFCAAIIASALVGSSSSGYDELDAGTIFMYGGYLTGMSLGVHYFGNDKYEKAGFSKSLLGALAGLPIGYLIYKSDPTPHGFTAVAPFLFPTLGAVISFNLSAKPK